MYVLVGTRVRAGVLRLAVTPSRRVPPESIGPSPITRVVFVIIIMYYYVLYWWLASDSIVLR